jgi:hypothetical protein
MLDIEFIYQKYEIPPNLQLHMKRVAALAKLIANNWQADESINSEVIIDACLLHDLGNIIKFDFVNFPELLGAEIKNLEHWKAVKDRMISLYGSDEDLATVKIVRELNVSDEVLFIVENWGFRNFTRIAQSNNWNWKIAVYADHRISPSGIVTLKQNLENKQRRYSLSKTNASHISDQAEILFRSALEVEVEIQKRTKLDLQMVNNEMLL